MAAHWAYDYVSNIGEKTLRKIVINADDFGLSDGICEAIKKLMDLNAISNTTIMVGAIGCEQRIRKKKYSEVLKKAGIHLQLSGGRPIAEVTKIPTLIDRANGLFKHKKYFSEMNPFEVEVEWRCQIEKGFDILGGKPTHIDSHHGAHRHEQFKPIYIKLAKEYGLSLRGGVEIGFLDTEQNLVSSSICLNSWTGRGYGTDFLLDEIESKYSSISPSGILEIVSHPGFNDNYLEKVSSLNEARYNDFNVLCQLAADDTLNKLGYKLVSYPLLEG